MRQKDRDREESFNMKIKEIKRSLQTIRHHLAISDRIQEALQAIHSQDFHMAERNLDRVTWWSSIDLIVLILTGGIQVIMVKSLFDENYKMHKFVWSKFGKN